MSHSRTCYWCGEPSRSYDHVPPKNLFPDDKRKKLIKVPSCDAHNRGLSKEDEMFRFYLQACAESPDSLRLLGDKTLRGLTKPEAQGLAKRLFRDMRVVTENGYETRALNIDPNRQNLYFEKLTRGIFYHLFQRRIESKIWTVSPNFMAPGLDYDALAGGLLPYLGLSGAIEGDVAQPEIFRYRYFHFISTHRETFIVRMIFYESIAVVGFFERAENIGTHETSEPVTTYRVRPR